MEQFSLSNLRLAVLIDADNVPYRAIKGILEETALYGTPTIKRIYGDWTRPSVSGWKDVLLENAITPVQQYSYTTGKNSTDSAMIIDAMDILYSAKVDGFCIVSSDSDFTRLATRLREAGMKVIGIGEIKTPNPFIVACDKFVYIEVLLSHQVPEKQKEPISDRPIKPERPGKVPGSIKKLITASIADLADDEGWAFLGEVGNLLAKKQPDFDPRNFGFPKLTPLIRTLDEVEIDVRESNQPHIKHIYIRLRKV